jgi:Flp pilus assembly protein TadB
VLNNLLIFALGLLVGWFFTWYYFNIRHRWRSSRGMHQQSEKVLKENADRAKKAREQSKQAYGGFVRLFTELVLFVVAVVVMAWMVWTVLTF